MISLEQQVAATRQKENQEPVKLPSVEECKNIAKEQMKSKMSFGKSPFLMKQTKIPSLLERRLLKK